MLAGVCCSNTFVVDCYSILGYDIRSENFSSLFNSSVMFYYVDKIHRFKITFTLLGNGAV